MITEKYLKRWSTRRPFSLYTFPPPDCCLYSDRVADISQFTTKSSQDSWLILPPPPLIWSLVSVYSPDETRGCGRRISAAASTEQHTPAQATWGVLFASTGPLVKRTFQARYTLFSSRRKPSTVDRLKATSLRAPYPRRKLSLPCLPTLPLRSPCRLSAQDCSSYVEAILHELATNTWTKMLPIVLIGQMSFFTRKADKLLPNIFSLQMSMWNTATYLWGPSLRDCEVVYTEIHPLRYTHGKRGGKQKQEKTTKKGKHVIWELDFSLLLVHQLSFSPPVVYFSYRKPRDVNGWCTQ